MARKPNTGASGSGARQGSKCSGKNFPANKSIANFSQDHSANNFGARERRADPGGGACSHHGRDFADVPIVPSEDRLLITLEARGHGKFDALFKGKRIVQASSQPICDAARILHRLGHQEHILLVARHHGADHDAIRGPLGVWRRLRIREGRGCPRYAKWEPFPLRPVAVIKGRARGKATGHRTGKKNAPTAAPGAGKGHSSPPAPSTTAVFDPEHSDA